MINCHIFLKINKEVLKVRKENSKCMNGKLEKKIIIAKLQQ
jgi:hypothetical protein